MDFSTLELTIIGVLIFLTSVSTLQKIKIKYNSYKSNVNRFKKTQEQLNTYDFDFDKINQKASKDLDDLRKKSHQSALNDEDFLVSKN